MKVLKQYNPINDDDTYGAPIEVVRIADTLRDRRGMIVGIKDACGRWVSATLYGYGVKVTLKVIQ